MIPKYIYDTSSRRVDDATFVRGGETGSSVPLWSDFLAESLKGYYLFFCETGMYYYTRSSAS